MGLSAGPGFRGRGEERSVFRRAMRWQKLGRRSEACVVCVCVCVSVCVCVVCVCVCVCVCMCVCVLCVFCIH